MDAKKKVFMMVGILILLVVIFHFVTSSITKYTGFFVVEDDEKFKACLNHADIKLYINSNDASASMKKILVFDYLENVEIVNCARNNEVCLQENVSEFPTWIVEGEIIKRDISVKELAEFSGCKLI